MWIPVFMIMLTTICILIKLLIEELRFQERQRELYKITLINILIENARQRIEESQNKGGEIWKKENKDFH